MARREYGAGSVHQAHAKDCPRPVDGAGKSRCSCTWRGTLEAGVTERGTRRRITVTGKTEAAAKRRVRDRNAEIKRAEGRATRGDSARKTVTAWGEDWLALRLDDPGVRPNTWTSDRTMVRRYIAPTIGRVRLPELTPAHVRAVHVKARAIGAPTAAKAHRVLMKMLRDALAEGYAVPSLIFEATAPAIKGSRKPVRDALTTAEAVAILSHATGLPDGVRWFVGLYEGMRQGEVLGLTWDCVDLDRGLLDVSWQLQAIPYRERFKPESGFRIHPDQEARHLVGRFHLVRPKTSRGERVIPMVPTVAEALRVWRDVAPANPHGLVWARGDGWPIDKADDGETWRTLQTAAGVKHPSGRPYYGHEMRNTTATLLAEAGVDEAIVIAIIGHSSIATTRGYVTARQDAMRAALANVEAAFTTRAVEG